MAGQSAMIKPSRSDEVLNPNEQNQITEQIRARFDSITPKRPQKPTRSDPDTADSTDITSVPGTAIPELDKFQTIKGQPVFHTGGGVGCDEEFVETSYYEGMISIDKQHHTTGTGFIKVGEENDENGESEYDYPMNFGGAERKAVAVGMRGNPAMNDWVPAAADENSDQTNCHLAYNAKPIRSG